MKKVMIVIGDNPKANVKVQKILFDAGFSWPFDGKRVYQSGSWAVCAGADGGLSSCAGDRGINYIRTNKDEYEIRSWEEITPELAATFEGAKKAVEVKELTMEQLNKISVEKLGYEIKIKKA